MLLVGAVWPAVMQTVHRKEKIHRQSSLFEQSWNERQLGAMNSRVWNLVHELVAQRNAEGQAKFY